MRAPTMVSSGSGVLVGIYVSTAPACWLNLAQLQARREIPQVVKTDFPCSEPVLQDEAALGIDRPGGPLRRGGEKLLQHQPALVGQGKQPAHQLEEPRFLPDIQQFEQLGAPVLAYRREHPVHGIDRRIAVARTESIE